MGKVHWKSFQPFSLCPAVFPLAVLLGSELNEILTPLLAARSCCRVGRALRSSALVFALVLVPA